MFIGKKNDWLLAAIFSADVCDLQENMNGTRSVLFIGVTATA